MEDVITINPMAASEKDKITRIFNEYSKRLLGFIRKRVNNLSDAEDILQDVFYRFLGNTEPIDQLASWLYTVARNRINDNYRKNKAAPQIISTYDQDDEINFDWKYFIDDGKDPETAYLRNIFWEELTIALEGLPEEQRSVFIQHEMEGLSFNQIAETSGVSVNTLLSRKRYAVMHLRKHLQVLHDELLNY